MIKRLIDRLRYFGCYVIADANDNSVTLSRLLFRRMGGMRLESAKVFVFRLPQTGHYAFTINPAIDSPTQLADIQYNAKYRCVGFECLVPTVNRIFYDYGICPNIRVKLDVCIETAPNGMKYYIISKPHGKHNRKQQKA